MSFRLLLVAALVAGCVPAFAASAGKAYQSTRQEWVAGSWQISGCERTWVPGHYRTVVVATNHCPPPVVHQPVVYQPVAQPVVCAPAPVWVPGRWVQSGCHQVWVEGHWEQPAYVQPTPVYVQPAPIYVERPVYVQPQPRVAVAVQVGGRGSLPRPPLPHEVARHVARDLRDLPRPPLPHELIRDLFRK